MTEITAATEATNQDQTFSTRTVPWMKLGKIEESVQSAADAAKLGGLDFHVREEPVYFGNPGKMKKVEGRKALVRDDTGEWLSIVSKAYPVVQYGEAFDFMDAVSPRFVAAGALRGGKQGFMVVETDVEVTVADGDTTRIYGVLRTSHDASRAIEVNAMPLRHMCMNQLTLPTFSKTSQFRWSVVHAGNVKQKLIQAKESLERLALYATSYEANAKRLLNIKVDDERAVEVLKFALPDRPKRETMIETIVTNWHLRPETVGYDGTGWGLVNAVSEHFEWTRTHGTPESRFLGALQGATRNAINKTATYLLTRA